MLVANLRLLCKKAFVLHTSMLWMFKTVSRVVKLRVKGRFSNNLRQENCLLSSKLLSAPYRITSVICRYMRSTAGKPGLYIILFDIFCIIWSKAIELTFLWKLIKMNHSLVKSIHKRLHHSKSAFIKCKNEHTLKSVHIYFCK